MEDLKKLYFEGSTKKFIRCFILREYEYYTYKYHRLLRKEEASKTKLGRGFWRIKKNRLGIKLGFYVCAGSIGENVRLWRPGYIQINGAAKLGDNCQLHGMNIIGNSTKNNDCAVIGNNVDIGMGALIVGGVHIADNVVIGAGAVVIRDCDEPGATYVGVPARKVIRKAAENAAE